jgi:hypothetical protein
MSDTPRTDAFIENWLSAVCEDTTWEDFCRRLERELAWATKEKEKLTAIVAGGHLPEGRDAILEEAEDAMLAVFSDMSMAYLFTSGFDSRIMKARDAIRALRSLPQKDEQ